MKKIYVEVGTNYGTDTDQFIKDDSIVYCFEPTKELVQIYVDWKAGIIPDSDLLKKLYAIYG